MRWYLGRRPVLHEIRQLIAQRFLERGARFAAFAIGLERRILRDQVGVAQDAQHADHHQVGGGVAVFQVFAAAQRCGEFGEPALEELLGLRTAQVVAIATIPPAIGMMIYLLRTPPAEERRARAERRRREMRDETPPSPPSEEPTAG